MTLALSITVNFIVIEYYNVFIFFQLFMHMLLCSQPDNLSVHVQTYRWTH